MAKKPDKLTLRSYDVGFGDCFLLSFHYGSLARHLLIDFGTMRLPEGKSGRGDYMERIANQIKADCGGKLTAVVATHRHRDHISGFAMQDVKGSGAIIRSLKPDLVIQPWTEDPNLARDAIGPKAALRGKQGHQTLHLRALIDMNRYAGYVKENAAFLKGGHLREIRDQLVFLGGDNELANRESITNLMTMGKKLPRYVHYGAKSGLDPLLPGVTTQVLGPPTLKQTDEIRRQRDTDPNEFWHLRAAFWARRGALATLGIDVQRPLFPKQLVRSIPWDGRWYRFHAQLEQAESTLSIVRTLDQAMNNTSVILLIKIGETCLLFPGDAQYENWMYALSQKGIPELLANVNVYKVGHHGSLNATPKRLWRSFKNKGGPSKPKRLLALLSTKDGVHGGKNGAPTEVPRSTLVEALRQDSSLVDTRAAKGNELRLERTINLA